MTSVYQSQTHGQIPLSKEARALMARLRDAIDAYKAGRQDWMPIAHARGELATYMSKLERSMITGIIENKWNKLPWYSGTISGRLSGSADMICLDNPQNLERTDMAKKKAEAARKKAAAKFRNIGVRFLVGSNLAKVYEYRIRRAAKVHLGQEFVVTNDNGVSVVVVVRIDGPIECGYTLDSLKEITAKVAAL